MEVIKHVLTIPEASAAFGLSKHTLRNLCNHNTIKYFKSGRRFYIITSSLIDLLNFKEDTYYES